MSRIVERAIDGSNGEVSVRCESSGDLVIRWMCGETRTFHPQLAVETIEHIELLEDYEDVWLELEDSWGSKFMARVQDDALFANTSAHGGHSVPWRDLKKLVNKAMD